MIQNDSQPIANEQITISPHAFTMQIEHLKHIKV